MSSEPSPSEETPPPGSTPPGLFPRATVGSSSRFAGLWSRTWWLSLICLVVAIVLFVASSASEGPRISIRFDVGHGLEAEASVLHRGIRIGRVEEVALAPEGDGVRVEAVLEPSAAPLAREGTVFWIARPQLSLARMSGLDTVVGAKYLALVPGPEGGPTKREFVGAESPLQLVEEDASREPLTIHFEDGHGLTVGDALRHRGIRVGEVTSIRLSEDLRGVVAELRLLQSAEKLAREGARFWIERPRLSLAGVRGIDTIVGGRYIAVAPGRDDGPPQRRFDGLEDAPFGDGLGGGLELILESPERGNLQPGAPVSYRGIQIGEVVSVGLSSDAASVEALARVEEPYREIVRERTVFWNASGLGVDVGWSGLEVDMESLTTLAAGGVSLATPPEGGDAVSTGHLFRLHVEAEEEWRQWSPRLPVGSSVLPGGASLPSPLRAKLRWQTANLVGYRSTHRREGWLLLGEDLRIYGPSNLLEREPGAHGEASTLELAGHELSLAAAPVREGPLRVATFPLPEEIAPDVPRWRLARFRRLTEPEDVLAVADPRQPALPLDAGRFEPAAEGPWKISRSLVLTRAWHGAAVVSRTDGAIVGWLAVSEEEVLFLPYQ